LSGLSAAVGYYAAPSSAYADDSQKCPTAIAFCEKDAGIPLTDVETIKSRRPEVEVFIYPGAQHGFHCDERASYDKTSATSPGRAAWFFCEAFALISLPGPASANSMDMSARRVPSPESQGRHSEAWLGVLSNDGRQRRPVLPPQTRGKG